MQGCSHRNQSVDWSKLDQLKIQMPDFNNFYKPKIDPKY